VSFVPAMVSFLFALLLSPVAIRVGKRIGLCDVPDGSGLKIHRSPIPKVGGLPVFVSVGLTLMVAPMVLRFSREEAWAILLLCLLVVMLGMADDLKNLSPLVRLSGQCLVSILMMGFGFMIHTFPVVALNLAFTGVIIVGAINAVNLLDGMDGLASGVSAVCCMAFGCLALYQGNRFVFLLSSVLLGALLGFLPYNSHPARAFLGDHGSTLVGFLMGLMVVFSANETGSLAHLLGPLFVLGVPLIDTAWAVARRVRARRSIFTGDREHFYDQLMRKGFTQRETAFIGYSLSLGFGLLGVTISVLG